MVGGVAIYVGSILGAGSLVLPGIAYSIAGPASIISWAILVALSVPTALTFARLGALYPDAGGIATFVRRAFGPRAARAVGYLFYLAPPFGLPVNAIVGGIYVEQVTGGGIAAVIGVAVGLSVVTFAVSLFGLRVSGGMQIAVVAILAAIFLVATVGGVRHAEIARFEPFAPHGVWGVLQACGALFFTFAGWEAVTHLSDSFADPRRTLPRLAWWALGIVAALYPGIVIVGIAALGPRLAHSPAAIADLLVLSLGVARRVRSAVVVVLVTLGTMISYQASVARLGVAMARDGFLPGWVGAQSRAGVPFGSILTQAALCTIVSVFAVEAGVSYEVLLGCAGACFAAVTLAGLAAGIRLTECRSKYRTMAVVGFLFTLGVVVCSGWSLVVPAAIVLGSVLVSLRSRAGEQTE